MTVAVNRVNIAIVKFLFALYTVEQCICAHTKVRYKEDILNLKPQFTLSWHAGEGKIECHFQGEWLNYGYVI